MNEPLTLAALAGMIDHTLLRADATEADLARHCQQALEHRFATVVVSSASAAFCALRLEGSDVGLCAAVSFPLGQTSREVKVYEATYAIENGATEIDFVINIGTLKSGRMCYVADEIKLVVQACGERISKVVLETHYLSDREKQAVCEMAIDAGAAYVKTSTGMGPGGVTLPDALLLKSLAKGRIKVEAAGGIRTLDQALSYIDAGCERIGTSHAIAIMAEAVEVLPS